MNYAAFERETRMKSSLSPQVTQNTQLDQVMLDRRNVIKLIGSACAVSSLASQLSGCVIAEVFTELGTRFTFDLSDPQFEALKTVGEAVDVDDAAGRPVILIRTSETEIMAVNRICTHTQCDMKLGGFGEWDGEKIICKCHNSHFAPTGEVLNPPADRPLPSYEVKFDVSNERAEIVFAADLTEEMPAGEQAGAEAGEQAGAEAGEQAGAEAGDQAGAEILPLNNPFEGDQDAISEGESLYQTNCVFCHGEAGVGDTFPGADAFDIDQSAWSDAHLFDVLTNGIPGTSMGAYKDTLTEDERWKVITYLRSLRTDQ